MSNQSLKIFFRALLLVAVQVLILKRINLGDGWLQGTQVFLYPMFILLIPLRTPMVPLLFMAFALGLAVDMFYDSPGVHASALVFMAYLRPFVLTLLQPREGYNVNHTPSRYHLGMNWFLSYAAILLFIQLFFYFSVEAFTFVYIQRILWRTIVSFLLSLGLILTYVLLFNPR